MPPPDLVAKSLTIPAKVASKDEVVITYVVENEGAGETDRSWWIDTIVSHKDAFFFTNNFEGAATLKTSFDHALEKTAKSKLIIS